MDISDPYQELSLGLLLYVTNFREGYTSTTTTLKCPSRRSAGIYHTYHDNQDFIFPCPIFLKLPHSVIH